MSAGGGDQKSEDAKSGCANSQNPISPVNTTKELADALGIGHQTMSRVMQIDEHAPAAVKEALDSGDLSINQGYNITRQVRELPEDFTSVDAFGIRATLGAGQAEKRAERIFTTGIGREILKGATP